MFSIVSAPEYYSPYSNYGYSRQDYLRSIAEAQAAREQYIQFLAAKEELRRQRELQAFYERRRYEARLLAELARVRSDLASNPHDDYPSFYIRPDQHLYRPHVYRFASDRGDDQTPDSFTFKRHPRVTPRRFCPSGRPADGVASIARPDVYEGANLDEVWKLLMGDFAEQPRKEQESKCPRSTIGASNPCRGRPLNPRCQKSTAYQRVFDDGDNAAKIAPKCPQRGNAPFSFLFKCSPDSVRPSQGGTVGHPANVTSLKAGSAVPRSAPNVESIKEELERRLYSNPDIEIQDTARALLESLATVTSSSDSAQPSKPSPEGADKKGKAKEASPSETAGSSSPTDVAASLNAIRNVEASLRALESEFVFPPQLDFDTTPPSPALSVHSVSSTPSSALTYTSKNAPVRYYEHALSSLLTDLDAIESFGSDEIRSKRKDIVAKVESALEEVEREVQGRLDAQKKREASVRSVQTEAVDSPMSQQELNLEDAGSHQQDLSNGNSETHVDPSNPSLEEGNSSSSDEPLFVPSPSGTPLPSVPGEPCPNRKRTPTDTTIDFPLPGSTSTAQPDALDQSESLADSSLTARPPSVELNEQSIKAEVEETPQDVSISSPERVITALPPSATDQEADSSDESTGTPSTDDDAILIDNASDGGWSEVASDA